MAAAMQAFVAAAFAIGEFEVETLEPVGAGVMLATTHPAGTTDVVGRQFAAALGKALGTTFVVENQGGASGAIGCQAALDAGDIEGAIGHLTALTENAPKALTER